MARSRGHVAEHVTHMGWRGTPDHVLVREMSDGDWTLVTNNGRDFRKLAASLDIHAGLIIFVEQGDRDHQMKLMGAVLDYLAAREDLVNGLLEVRTEDDIRYSPLPSPEAV